MIYILAFSANSKALQNKNMIWLQNAVGVRYSPQGGFGLPDLAEAYALIPTWTSLGTPRMYTCSRADKLVKFSDSETENLLLVKKILLIERAHK